MRCIAQVGIAATGRLAARHMIARGQPLAQFNAFLSGQHGISPAIVITVESTVVARAGATKEPTINPRIASIVRVRVIANHRDMAHCYQRGAEMSRKHSPWNLVIKEFKRRRCRTSNEAAGRSVFAKFTGSQQSCRAISDTIVRSASLSRPMNSSLVRSEESDRTRRREVPGHAPTSARSPREPHTKPRPGRVARRRAQCAH